MDFLDFQDFLPFQDLILHTGAHTGHCVLVHKLDLEDLCGLLYLGILCIQAAAQTHTLDRWRSMEPC